MITLRKSGERGHANFGWLESRHSFSFGQYHDPRHMGFGPLRVINDDRVVGGAGFGTHGHADMEIVTYVLEGGLAHRDSLGHGSTIKPGDVQRMSAGTGIEHSEYNASKTEPAHFLQIWILPERQGLAPSYEEKHFPEAERRNQLKLVAARQPSNGALTIHRDVAIYAALLDDGASVRHSLTPGRRAWLQIARGGAEVNGIALEEGDGLSAADETELRITGRGSAEFLLFDLD
jgi:quercetin 2,3-dioxygenase